MDAVMEKLVDFATSYGLQVIGAILILIIGRIVAGGVRKLLRRSLTARGTDPAIVGFAAAMAYYLVMIFAIIAILGNFGIETASLVAVLGAAGFAIGFALQGSLANFAAGVLLLVFRPYRIGDYVDVAGTAGTVKEMGILVTILTTPDNTRIIIPNGKIFGDIIKNITAEDTRRVDMVVGIGYGSSIESAVKAIQGVLDGDDRILGEPAPQIAVAELADSSVNLVVRPWVKKADYWGVKFDVTRKIKEALDQQGVEIPFPQVTIHRAKA